MSDRVTYEAVVEAGRRSGSRANSQQLEFIGKLLVEIRDRLCGGDPIAEIAEKISSLPTRTYPAEKLSEICARCGQRFGIHRGGGTDHCPVAGPLGSFTSDKFQPIDKPRREDMHAICSQCGKPKLTHHPLYNHCPHPRTGYNMNHVFTEKTDEN